MIRNIIIEGLDRLGKDTLIDGLLNQFGYRDILHYQRPKELAHYSMNPDPAFSYQRASFTNMFRLLGSGALLILNRAHIGECVYAPLYRGYTGEYVFDLEQAAIAYGNDFCEASLLVLMTTSEFSFMLDDGKSFDVTKREQEQKSFVRAFNKSAIINKLRVDVHDGRGNFRPPRDILNEVVYACVSS